MDRSYLELLKYRGSMYRLFASLYIEEIDRPMLEKLLKLKLPRIRKAEESWQIDFNAGYELFENYLNEYKGKNDDEIKDMLEDLAADYAKVFLAAGEVFGGGEEDEVAAEGEALHGHLAQAVGDDVDVHAALKKNGVLRAPFQFRDLDLSSFSKK